MSYNVVLWKDNKRKYWNDREGERERERERERVERVFTIFENDNIVELTQ